jgi:hypothetical protein
LVRSSYGWSQPMLQHRFEGGGEKNLPSFVAKIEN